ncbi:hypothetical protein [Dyadobacter sp. NIV53]|uniref:hypothetical protein n=1 Tax=Dyadobacter sp. NIV53 TaxID=2861765 RepID=UPI001C880404|nr:hypothetical protein [Dyadobacter sp. NIV53]
MSQSNTSVMQVGSIPMSKNLSVANNCAIEVVMLNTFSDDNSLRGYEQNLVQLGTASGQKSLAAKSTATIALDAAGITPSYLQVYNIIYAKASNLFPVKIGRSAPSYQGRGYDPVTITDDDVMTMTQTEQFLQTISAYPTSSLSQNYAAAMQAIQNGNGTDTDIEAGVSQFFAATSFPNVTIDSISAVTTYFSQFPNVWAAYQPTRTHYLYSGDGSSVTYAGSITISLPAVTTYDKSLPGFGLSFTDADGATKPLYFIDGQFIDNKSVAAATVCLSGTFVLKSTLTGVATDNTIVPVLTGLVSGKKVLGYDSQAVPNPENTGYDNYPHANPDSFFKVLKGFGIFFGVCLAISLCGLAVMAILDRIKEYKDSIRESQESDDPDFSDDLGGVKLDELKSDGESDIVPVKEKLQKLLDDIDVDVNLDSKLPDLLEDAGPKIEEMQNEEQKELLEEEGEAVEGVIGSELDNGVNNIKLQNDVDKVDAALEKLEDASGSELVEILPEVESPIAEVKVDADANYQKAESLAEGQAHDDLETAGKEEGDLAAEVENFQKEEAEEETGNTEDTKFTENELEG